MFQRCTECTPSGGQYCQRMLQHWWVFTRLCRGYDHCDTLCLYLQRTYSLSIRGLWQNDEGADSRCFSVKQDMVHPADPQRLVPEEKKNSEKRIIRRLTDAEIVIENDFKSEAEVSGGKRLGPSSPRCPCSFWYDTEGRIGPRPVGARGKQIICHPFKPIFFKLFRLIRGLANVFEKACPNCRQNFFRVWKHYVTRTIFMIIPGDV